MERWSDVNGWHPVLALMLQCNLLWMENARTGVIHAITTDHRVSAAQSALAALPPSARKSGMQEATDDLIFDSQGFDADSHRITDATRKGVENLLLKERRGICSSSEGANTTHAEGHTDRDAGIHLMSKSRFRQYSQSEAISTATGAGMAPVRRVRFNPCARLTGASKEVRHSRCQLCLVARFVQGVTSMLPFEIFH